MRYLLIALLALTACGDSTSSPAAPSWCSEEASVLAGEWEGRLTRHDHHYELALALEETGECTFEWSYQSYLLEHEDQPRLLIYESRGLIIIVETHAAADLVSMAMEGQRTYLYTRDGRVTSPKIKRPPSMTPASSRCGATTSSSGITNIGGRHEPICSTERLSSESQGSGFGCCCTKARRSRCSSLLRGDSHEPIRRS